MHVQLVLPMFEPQTFMSNAIEARCDVIAHYLMSQFHLSHLPSEAKAAVFAAVEHLVELGALEIV